MTMTGANINLITKYALLLIKQQTIYMGLSITERKQIITFQYKGDSFRFDGNTEVFGDKVRSINISIYDMADGAYIGSIGELVEGNIMVNTNTHADLASVVTMYAKVKPEILASVEL